MSPVVICAGMRRSGSTLQSQLVASLLGAARVRPTNAASAAIARQEQAEGGGPLVLKCHEFIPEAQAWLAAGDTRIVFVYRDIRDVVASICRKYSVPAFSFIGGGAAMIMHEHAQWSTLPGIHVARYEDMVGDLPREIERLAEFLRVPMDRGRAAALAEEFSPDRQQARISAAFEAGGSIVARGSANEHVAGSLLHRNHIQSGAHGAYRQVLRRHEVAALEWVTRHWLRANGYQFDSQVPASFLAYGWFALRSFVHTARQRAFPRIRQGVLNVPESTSRDDHVEVENLVSVVIPVFNRPQLVEEAVASALAQTHPSTELLIVDDGSGDETWATVQRLAGENSGKLFAFRQENAGPGAARNLGLRHARGEFVQFLDSDDLLQPCKFEVQVRALRMHPAAALAYGKTLRIDVESGETRTWARTAEPIAGMFPDFLMKRGWDTNSPLWRRSACRAIGPWSELRSMEDWEHDLRAGMQGLKPVQVPEHVATVRDHAGARASAMKTGFTPEMTADIFRAHRSIWGLMREKGLLDWSYLEAFSRKLFWISRLCGERHLLAEAEEALAMAEEMVSTRHYPWEMRRFRALTRLLGWPRAVALGDAVRRGLGRQGATANG